MLALSQYFSRAERPLLRRLTEVPLRALSSRTDVDAEALANRVRQGERLALSKAITLVESGRPSKRAVGVEVMEHLMRGRRRAGTSLSTLRVGISGPPGVGKSTFIESLGKKLCDAGEKVAVLAVDPSSEKRGGSILGDLTRMTELSREENVYIRPSPSRGTLGGVARRTNEAIILCEGAGYTNTIVETVGVGQSETAVADLVDVFVLMVPPGGGDSLQGMKRGIMERADLVVVNKADGDMKRTAGRTRADYAGALRLMYADSGDEWVPQVVTCSAATHDNVMSVWEAALEYKDYHMENGRFEQRRIEQSKKWMWKEVTDELIAELHSNPQIRSMVDKLETAVEEGETTYHKAAHEILMWYRTQGTQ